MKIFFRTLTPGFTQLVQGLSSVSRAFVPSLESFFAEAIEQADPDEMVEDEYKWVAVDYMETWMKAT